MKISLKNNSSVRKWLSNLLSMVIFLVLFLFQDFIQKTPFFNEIICFLLMFLVFYFIRKINNERKKVKSGQQIRIKNQMDNLNSTLSFLFGILIVSFVVISNTNDTILIEKINYFLLGLILIISGLVNKKSVIISSESKSLIVVMDSNFSIHSEDKNVTFSMFQINLTKSNGQTNQLKELILDRNEANRIANWLNSKLNSSGVNYYWKYENQIEEIKTDTNTG